MPEQLNKVEELSQKFREKLEGADIAPSQTKLDEDFARAAQNLRQTIENEWNLEKGEKEGLLAQSEVFLTTLLGKTHQELVKCNLDETRCKRDIFTQLVADISALDDRLAQKLDEAGWHLSDKEYQNIVQAINGGFFQETANQNIWNVSEAVKSGWNPDIPLEGKYVQINTSENLRDPGTGKLIRKANAGEQFQIVGEAPSSGRYQYKMVSDSEGALYKLCINDGQNVSVHGLGEIVQVIQDTVATQRPDTSLENEVSSSTTLEALVAKGLASEDGVLTAKVGPLKIQDILPAGTQDTTITIRNNYNPGLPKNVPLKLIERGGTFVAEDYESAGRVKVGAGDLIALNPLSQETQSKQTAKTLINITRMGGLKQAEKAMANILDKENQQEKWWQKLIRERSGDNIDFGRTDFLYNNAQEVINGTLEELKKNPDKTLENFEKSHTFLRNHMGAYYANKLLQLARSEPGIQESLAYKTLANMEQTPIQEKSSRTTIWFDQESQVIKIFQPQNGKLILVDSFDARGGSRQAVSKKEDSSLHAQTKTPDGIFRAESIQFHTTQRYKSCWIAGSAKLKKEGNVIYHQFPGRKEWLPATGPDATFFIKGRQIRWDSFELQSQVIGGVDKLKETMAHDGVALSGNIYSNFKQWKNEHSESLKKFTEAELETLLEKGAYLDRSPFGDAPAINVGNTGTFFHQKVLSYQPLIKQGISSLLGNVYTPKTKLQSLSPEYAREGGAISRASHGCVSTFDHNINRMLSYAAPGAKIIISSNEDQKQEYFSKIKGGTATIS